ncbi:L,D-transpeptidase [soil metagenome]
MIRNARLSQGATADRKRSRLRGAYGMALALAMIAIMIVLPLTTGTAEAAPAAPQPSAPAASAQSDWSPPSTVYIPESGQSIDGVFLSYWRANGGVSAFGNPITAEITVSGRIVQYYEYARFEYWPEDADGNVVHLGNIGEELRPQLVMRQGSTAVANGAVAELARIARAWLPVTGNATSQETTETFVYVSSTGHTVSNGFKSLWEATGGASYLGNPLTEEYEVGGNIYQVFERGQLAWNADKDAWIVPVGNELVDRKGISTEVSVQGDIPTYDEGLFVRPELWVEVNLSEQFATIWIGNEVVMSTYVSTGRAGWDTPTGTFYINSKYETDDMEGNENGESWNVPDVPWTMYFTGEGHALHGTFWHNNFGAVMSHGCVNLPMDVAEYLYAVAPIGTRIEIHY